MGRVVEKLANTDGVPPLKVVSSDPASECIRKDRTIVCADHAEWGELELFAEDKI